MNTHTDYQDFINTDIDNQDLINIHIDPSDSKSVSDRSLPRSPPLTEFEERRIG